MAMVSIVGALPVDCAYGCCAYDQVTYVQHRFIKVHACRGSIWS